MYNEFSARHLATLIGRETTWGTAVTADKDIGLVQSLSIDESNNLEVHHACGSASAQAITAGDYEVGGDMEVKLQHGRLLEYLLGSVAHDATSTPDIKHTFTEADALKSFTLHDGYNATSDALQTYAGCILTNGTLSLDKTGVLMLKAGFIAKTVADTTTASAAVLSMLAPHPHYFATLSTGAAGAEVAVNRVQNFEFSVNNFSGGEPRDYSVGSRLAQSAVANSRILDFKFGMIFGDQVQYEKFLGSTSPSATSTPTIPSVLLNVTNGVAAASGLRQVYLKLLTGSFNESKKSVRIGEYVTSEFTGKAVALSNFYLYDSVTEANWG